MGVILSTYYPSWDDPPSVGNTVRFLTLHFVQQATVLPVAFAAKSPPVLAVDWWTIDLGPTTVILVPNCCFPARMSQEFSNG